MSKEAVIPHLYDEKENCCGCGACFAICPVNAIAMKEDEEGFQYPFVNENKCFKCYRCVIVCPMK